MPDRSGVPVPISHKVGRRTNLEAFTKRALGRADSMDTKQAA